MKHLWLPSCGGVEAAINVGPKQFRKRRRRDSIAFKSAILRARTNDAALFWDYENSSSDLYLADYRHIKLLQEINRVNQASSVITVQRGIMNNGNFGYSAIYGDEKIRGEKIIYESIDVPEFVRELALEMRRDKSEKIQLYINFINQEDKSPYQNKVNTFKRTLKRELSEKNIEFIQKEDNYLEVTFLPGNIEIEKNTSPIKSNGRFIATLHLIKRVRKFITVIVTANTAAMAEYIAQLKVNLGLYKHLSLMDNINMVRLQILATHKE